MNDLHETELTERIHHFMERKLDRYPELRVLPAKKKAHKAAKETQQHRPFSLFTLGSALYTLRSNNL